MIENIKSFVNLLDELNVTSDQFLLMQLIYQQEYASLYKYATNNIGFNTQAIQDLLDKGYLIDTNSNSNTFNMKTTQLILACSKEGRELIKQALSRQLKADADNGYNDIKMFEKSLLKVAVLGDEGLCSELLFKSDIAVKSIEDGINFYSKKIIRD